MKKIKFLFILIIFLSFFFSFQSQDIPVKDLPSEIADIVNRYVYILQTSSSVEDAASKLGDILGGGLLDSYGKISRDTMEFSLKKDYYNSKFYQYPIKITRVLKILNDYDGYQETYIEGTSYKVWIAKKDGVAGLPAPVRVIKPKDKAAKIIGIGSF